MSLTQALARALAALMEEQYVRKFLNTRTRVCRSVRLGVGTSAPRFSHEVNANRQGSGSIACTERGHGVAILRNTRYVQVASHRLYLTSSAVAVLRVQPVVASAGQRAA